MTFLWKILLHRQMHENLLLNSFKNSKSMLKILRFFQNLIQSSRTRLRVDSNSLDLYPNLDLWKSDARRFFVC